MEGEGRACCSPAAHVVRLLTTGVGAAGVRRLQGFSHVPPPPDDCGGREGGRWELVTAV